MTDTPTSAPLTFGRMESVGGYDDDRAADILRAGEVIGEIVAHRDDVAPVRPCAAPRGCAAGARRIRTVGYTVTLDGVGEADFDVDARFWDTSAGRYLGVPRGYPTARKALAAAKAWARSNG
jgi:hypothetical protein